MRRVRGFTLVELAVILLLVGILAIFVVPGFRSVAVFDTRGFADQVGAALRFAQKAAIAQRRTVCVTLAVDSLTLTQSTAPPPSAACGAALTIPGASGNVLNAPAGVTLSPGNLLFTALGQAVPGTTVTVTGEPPPRIITVEGETGYVH